MKKNITISLDLEIIHELQLRNLKGQISNIIGDLLKSYLQLTPQEVDIEEKELENELLEQKAKVMLIEQKQAAIKQKREEAEAELKRQITEGEVIDLDAELN